jgi:hypothetical protein
MSRQGKSALIRALTGLGDDLIPTGDQGPCTRVRSIIENRAGSVSAQVTFHTHSTLFQEVILPHFEKLRFLSRPATFDEFLGMQLPLAAEGTGSRAHEMLDRLRAYQQHAGELDPFLAGPTTREVPVAEFRQFVADYDSNGREPYRKWLAVRHARIFCPLAEAEVAQVALVDMPGLGDTGVGDEDRLLSALAAEVDSVLFLKKPKPTGDKIEDDEQRVWELANGAQPGVPAKLWTFWLFNRDSNHGDNATQCDSCQAQLPQRHVEVAKVMVADCTDRTAVGGVLDAVLDHLGQNIESLDAAFARTRRDALTALLKEIEEWCTGDLALAQRFGKVGGNEFRIFQSRFDDLFRALKIEFQLRYREMSNSRDLPHAGYTKTLEQIFEKAKAEPGIPDEQEFSARAAEEGALGKAYLQVMNEVRARLSHRFLALDEPLQASGDELRAEVRKVFDEVGHFSSVFSGADAAWWSEVIRFLLEAAELGDEFPNLIAGFQLLAGFRLTYRGFAQWRVRFELDRLTPDLAEDQLPPQPTLKQARELVTAAYGEACFRMRERLEELANEPNAAVFAIFEEFMDGVFHAQGARAEWQRLYHSLRNDIWREDFAEVAKYALRQQHWLRQLRAVKDAVREAEPRF